MADASDEVLAHVENRVGLIVLNRPKAINSLTDSMVETIQATLSAWEGDDDVSAVMISGEPVSAACAPAATWWRSTTAHAPMARKRADSGTPNICLIRASVGTPSRWWH